MVEDHREVADELRVRHERVEHGEQEAQDHGHPSAELLLRVLQVRHRALSSEIRAHAKSQGSNKEKNGKKNGEKKRTKNKQK